MKVFSKIHNFLTVKGLAVYNSNMRQRNGRK